MVCPSGSALATALTPMAPPPPGRFSIMMGCPTFADTCSNTVRGRRSMALPGENGTMIWTRLLGQVCAASGAAAIAANAPASVTIVAIEADLRAFARLCISSSRGATACAARSRASLADRASAHHRQARWVSAREDDELGVAARLAAEAFIGEHERRTRDQELGDVV